MNGDMYLNCARAQLAIYQSLKRCFPGRLWALWRHEIYLINKTLEWQQFIIYLLCARSHQSPGMCRTSRRAPGTPTPAQLFVKWEPQVCNGRAGHSWLIPGNTNCSQMYLDSLLSGARFLSGMLYFWRHQNNFLLIIFHLIQRSWDAARSWEPPGGRSRAALYCLLRWACKPGPIKAHLGISTKAQWHLQQERALQEPL